MIIIRKEDYKNQLKKLKKYHKEGEHFEKIICHIEASRSYENLRNNPLSKIYGFEELKYELSGYCSFNLSGNGGKFRLICRKLNNDLEICYISTDHYKDFKNTIKKNK